MRAPDIFIQEVAPRDGLQIEPVFVETAEKVQLVDALSQAGFTRIEVSSFVSPKAVPALADAEEVFSGIRRNPRTIYVALVPNRKGAERAIAARADEINFVMSASETHNRANMGMRHEQSLAALSDIVAPAHAAGGHRQCDCCHRIRLSVRRHSGLHQDPRHRAAVSRFRGGRESRSPTPPAWPIPGRSSIWFRKF